MLLTRDQLRARLEDGRWHQVSVTAAVRYSDTPRYDVERRNYGTGYKWVTCVKFFNYSHIARTHYRVRLKPEFVQPPHKEADMPAIPFAVQIPSLINLRQKCKEQLPFAAPEVIDALATLAQAAYEEYYDWVTNDPGSAGMTSSPPNPAEYETVAGLAAIYASLR